MALLNVWIWTPSETSSTPRNINSNIRFVLQGKKVATIVAKDSGDVDSFPRSATDFLCDFGKVI